MGGYTKFFLIIIISINLLAFFIPIDTQTSEDLNSQNIKVLDCIEKEYKNTDFFLASAKSSDSDTKLKTLPPIA